MKRFANRTIWICVLALLLCLGARLIWLASRTETGFEVLRGSWRDATVGLVTGGRKPVPSRQPAEQAEYWLREAHRVLASQPDNARRTMGAAWVLDRPGPGFLFNYLSKREWFPRAVGVLRSIGPPAIAFAALAFMAYLVVAPRVVDVVEREFQRKMAVARRPEDCWNEVERAVEAVKSDPEAMREIRETVDVEMAWPTESADSSTDVE